MINSAIEKFLLKKKEHYLISAEDVANVFVNNPLSHALLVLTKVKYSKIPVLDKGDRFVGLISLSNVTEKMVDVFDTEMKEEDFPTLTVADAMEVNVPTVDEDWELEEVLSLMVDYPFLPVVNDAQCFKGILTRKELLKAVNALAHEFEKEYHMIPKVENGSSQKVKILIEN
ncbi:CBS domain-containing protein [Pilibacter termitis]|uniref:CBS domain-containing protein n=1 Tax=Pilibacter termitis TaxID=263852 RepID=A0A1T4QPJ2_9ENTE|nr:cyclic-di-AMP-binding protein CbpB [Pilibacter termitis]SKA05702.1 CBS domain-containing protein [Pilibacter termitis]